MSENDEKKTIHNLVVRLLSESAITYDTALFQLAKAIDKDQLEENDLILIGFDFNDHDPGTHTKKNRGPSKIAALAARSPGVLGDLMALLTGRSKRDLYLGFCGAVLLSILLYKWAFRLITGTF